MVLLKWPNGFLHIFNFKYPEKQFILAAFFTVYLDN
jgi:hypothetical protein